MLQPDKFFTGGFDRWMYVHVTIKGFKTALLQVWVPIFWQNLY